MRTIKKKIKIYSVDWYRGDWCYCTTMGCTWEDVKECRQQAKLMGETIKYEHYDTRIDEYKIR
jgi:hypothetical protein